MSEEPVAYGVIVDGRLVEIRYLRNYNPDKDYDLTPLYTKEQLQPKVKMTQAEFDEFEKIPKTMSVYGALAQWIENNSKYPKLFERFGFDNKQAEFTSLWNKYNPNKPEETIEILSEKKWFVEYINDDSDYRFLGIEPDNKLFSNNTLKKDATYFDTEEEAELWTNPLTEAVLLPVEGE